ncbi:hypothetical protein EDD15DRAFT_2570243 [Pisolithus albus]|nr:hypothetical protein EDD15DRAFT_2570243 [Pisolithus albus]
MAGSTPAIPPAAQGQEIPQPPSSSPHSRGRGRGRGSVNVSTTPAEKIPKIRWDDKDPNIRAHTSRLITWCHTYPDVRIKLFSDCHQEAVNEGRRRQQMSAQKDVYLQQVASAVFSNDYDPRIRQLYAQHPSLFVKPIKNRFAALRKKYNDANKTLGSTGAGLTAEELKEDPQLKKLLGGYSR